MSVYRGMSRNELEAQYFLRGTRPGYEERDIPRWLEQSAQFRSTANASLDVPYGPLERNTLDFFSANGATSEKNGFVLYIHGGYWQRGDKSVYSYVAEPFVEHGFDVALINYQMCPDVRISEIAPQVRDAVLWLWRNADRFDLRWDNFNIMGHSAGGHLTAEMLATDWPALDGDLPRDLIHAGVAVSGIYDFEPILYCSENEGLRMDEAEAKAVSTIHRTPVAGTPLLLAHGMNEPSDMHRQSRALYDKFKVHCRRCDCLPVPAADHFETVDVLADTSSELFNKTLQYVSPSDDLTN